MSNTDSTIKDGSQQGKKVISVQGNTIPQNQPPVTAVVKQQQPPVPTPTTVDPNNIDIDKFIADSTGEVKQFDEKEAAKKEKMAYLTKAIDSTNKFRKIVFNNAETGEFVGTKIQYEPDEDGKSVYEYMNDPVVTEHIEFIVAEGDPVDGQPVDKQITFFWIKPTF